MALYVPPGRRRRRLWLAVGGALAVGVVVGVVLGRVTAPTVDDRVRSVHDDAAAAVAQLEALPVEYAQQLAGGEEFREGGATDAVDRAREQLDEAIGDAPWLTATQIDALHGALEDVRTAAEEEVDAERFDEVVAAATNAIQEVFGAD
jgi:F0F1-type ATP synthase membrane subunit b/b'